MDDKKKIQPKKIKMPPLVDRSQWYDTMSWVDDSFETQKISDENNSKNNSQSIPELESDQTS